jgi:hypothetical protein
MTPHGHIAPRFSIPRQAFWSPSRAFALAASLVGVVTDVIVRGSMHMKYAKLVPVPAEYMFPAWNESSVIFDLRSAAGTRPTTVELHKADFSDASETSNRGFITWPHSHSRTLALWLKLSTAPGSSSGSVVVARGSSTCFTVQSTGVNRCECLQQQCQVQVDHRPDFESDSNR